MSEYTGGPLDALARLFMEALMEDEPAEKKQLIDEWNESVKYCNSVLKAKEG